jgi:tellurite resistance protein TerC
MIVIYTSNIFAVLGLRSLFFLLRGAVDRFTHLQQGIAVVLIFVGLKMLAEIWHIYLPVYVSLLVILVCITTAILYSLYSGRKMNENSIPSEILQISSRANGNSSARTTPLSTCCWTAGG